MNQKKIIIAIDGYSSTGKSSFAKKIAAEIGYIYVDTGAMYRAVTFYCIQNNLINGSKINVEGVISALSKMEINFSFNSVIGKSETVLNGENVESQIRNIEVSNHVSSVSAIPEVRTQMVALQQQIGTNKGVVMDGRDIGTVVFPNAELKIFMTAEPKIRAQRRYKELLAKGDNITLAEIEKNITERDFEDTHRATSPLRQAADAVVLDNSNLTPDEQMQWFRKIYNNIISK